jgi:hypothetical protein
MDDSEATFTWNYRLVDRSDKNEGEPWVEIVEVHYEDGKPIGFSDPSVNAETKELLLENLERIIKDIKEQPVLKMADFKRQGII